MGLSRSVQGYFSVCFSIPCVPFTHYFFFSLATFSAEFCAISRRFTSFAIFPSAPTIRRHLSSILTSLTRGRSKTLFPAPSPPPQSAINPEGALNLPPRFLDVTTDTRSASCRPVDVRVSEFNFLFFSSFDLSGT